MSFVFSSASWSQSMLFTLVVLGVIQLSTAILTPNRISTGPGYRLMSECPPRCSTTGPDPKDWPRYRNIDEAKGTCQQSLFYDFSVHDQIGNTSKNHHIFACSSYGQDWSSLPSRNFGRTLPQFANTTAANYQIGWWPESLGSSIAIPFSGLTGQLSQYLKHGFATAHQPVVLFTSFGSTSVGLYIGKSLKHTEIGDVPMQYLQDFLRSISTQNASSIAMQYCEPGQNADHTFGLIATGDNTFSTVQDAIKSWSSAQCMHFPQGHNLTAPLHLESPLYSPTDCGSQAQQTNGTGSMTGTPTHGMAIAPRTTSNTSSVCSAISVASGDSCGSLAQQCGISTADFTEYNRAQNLCSNLTSGEHVCCSAGTMPDFAPQQNSNGSCATYTITSGDSCANLAAKHSLTEEDISRFNNETWAWNGCADIRTGTIICLSAGSPPMPLPVANAVCGPQKPGTLTPMNGTNFSSLNPCPLNACCDVFGQCGITSEFCTDSRTGPPGTAANGTNGCISNCGTQVIKGDTPSTYRSIGYFEGFNLERPCLYQTVSQINASQYTHLYYSFGVLTSSYEVQISNATAEYEFGLFKNVSGPLKILSIGGWSFSTDPGTYMIFREGVNATNRHVMATNIAGFINNNTLDGVNIDWEYPGASDLPGIPAASSDDGANYLAFLQLLRTMLPNKEITVAAPASYWYLKGFPIAAMSKVIDYVIYMTYDLHGQSDSGNQWAQIGCPSGTCLQSDVNLTETVGALSMITKAGVPSAQVVVGVTSYGRSFKMAQAGCFTAECKFLGSANESLAAPGPCTQTPGYIANAEIQAIIANSSRVNQNFVDGASNSNILVYDDVQWVAWMNETVKASRNAVYKNYSMGGTTDWATDLQEYNPPPQGVSSWPKYVADASSDVDPYAVGSRTGNWTQLTCSNPGVEGALYFTPQERWAMLDCTNAWNDAINVWQNFPRDADFCVSVWNVFHIQEGGSCGFLPPGNNCEQTEECVDVQGFGSGPAGYEIYNSIVGVNALFSQLYTGINDASGFIDSQMGLFENTFAPVPPAKSDLWEIILIDLLALGLTAVAAPFLDGAIGAFDSIAALGETGSDVLKDIVYASVSFGAAIGSAALPSPAPAPWTANDQANFTAYLGQVLEGWAQNVERQLYHMFDGNATSVQVLTKFIQNGTFMEGNSTREYQGPQSPQAPSTMPNATVEQQSQIQNFIAKAFFGYAIPAVWTAASTAAFVLDSGSPCSAQNPMGGYMSNSTQEATYACYDNVLYYLVSFNGSFAADCHSPSPECDSDCSIPSCSSQFEAPPGLSSLENGAWGGITLEELIQGSVNTYKANGNKNNGPSADPLDSQTLTDLSSQNVTTPGYIRLPVCSGQIAYASWGNPAQSNTSAPGYPCNPLQGVTNCWGYTYEATDAAPLVSDCQQIITNVQGTAGSWTTDFAGQRAIVSSGDCKLGVQHVGADNGNANFVTGSQDVVNIINQSIKEFGSNGTVGAKGYMECRGNTGKSQKVAWGLY